MTAIRAILVCACVVTGLHPVAAFAHEGHDDAASPLAGTPGANVPRVEAQSDLFEIVGTVRNGTMTIFLDRYATNEPVIDAMIDIEAGALQGSAQADANGSYTFNHAVLAQPGQLPVTFTIAAGSDSDLLTGELVISDPDAAKAHASDGPLRQRWWWLAAALILLAGVGIAWWSRRKGVNGGSP